MPFRRIFVVLFVLITALAAFNFISAQSDQPLPLPSETDAGAAQFQDRATMEQLTNGGFEVDGNGDKLPDGWKAKNTDIAKADKLKCNKAEKVVAYAGNCAFQFSGNLTGETSKLTQTVNAASIADNSTLTFSAYVDPKNGVALSKIGSLTVRLSDGSKQKLDLRLPANAGAGYMLMSRSQLIVIPAGLIITEIKAEVSYGETVGKYLIDDVRLTMTTIEPTGTPITPVVASPTTAQPAITSTPTATVTGTQPATNTPTQTSTHTATSTPTATFTATATNTPTHTATNTSTATQTPAPTNTAAPGPGVIIVDSTADTNDASGGSGTCANSVGQCTLRAAIQTANYDSGANTIVFSLSGTQPVSITLTSILPTPSSSGGPLTIDGDVRANTVITANANVKAFNLTGLGSTLFTIRNLTFSGFNMPSANGSVIYSNGALLIIDNVQFVNNKGGDGGAIRIVGSSNLTSIRNSSFLMNSASHGGGLSVDAPGHTVNIINTIFDDNKATFAGGGIYAHGAQFRIINSLFRANQAGENGAALWSNDDVNLQLINSTIGENAVTNDNDYGGAISTFATATIINSTIAYNTAPGGGIYGYAILKNTILAYNDPYNCYLAITDGGNNLQFPEISCGPEIPTVDPLLRPLEAAGSTMIYPLGAGSPAINAGSNAQLPADTFDLDKDGNTTEKLPYDQRGMGYNRIAGSSVDLGAFEAQ